MARIIVLDDQNDICESLEQRLTQDGHVVKTARAGAEAIDLGYLFDPDILITDWDLQSEYNGFEVAEAVFAAKENVKAILITGHRVNEEIANAEFFAKFEKPFSLDRLAESVKRAAAC